MLKKKLMWKREGVGGNADISDQGGGRVWEMLTLADEGGGGV